MTIRSPRSTRRKGMALVLAAGLAGSMAWVATGHAADGGGGSSAQPTPDCRRGFVWNPRTKTCVRAQSGVLPDQELVAQGRQLALAGRYEDAIIVLETVSQKDDPTALTYLGYSHRKMGKVDEGIAYYQKALAIDPNDANAREYLGEGYVSSGRIDLAREELVKIEALCGRECEQYQDLAAAIAEQASAGTEKKEGAGEGW